MLILKSFKDSIISIEQHKTIQSEKPFLNKQYELKFLSVK